MRNFLIFYGFFFNEWFWEFLSGLYCDVYLFLLCGFYFVCGVGDNGVFCWGKFRKGLLFRIYEVNYYI